MEVNMEDTWKINHVGMPVRDLEKSVANLNSLGAVFQREFLVDSSKFAEYLVYGKTPDPVVKTRGMFAKLGPLRMELLQPVEGETVHKEFLESAGEGIGHIAFTVNDLEKETEKLVEKGFPVILSIVPSGRTERSAVYIDTRSKFSNLIIELIQAS